MHLKALKHQCWQDLHVKNLDEAVIKKLDFSFLPPIETGRVPSRASNSTSRPSLCTLEKIKVSKFNWI